MRVQSSPSCSTEDRNIDCSPLFLQEQAFSLWIYCPSHEDTLEEILSDEVPSWKPMCPNNLPTGQQSNTSSFI